MAVVENTDVAGLSEEKDVNRWLVLVIVCLAQFMVILDATITNVALPSIQHGLHFSASALQWVVNAYTLVFGGFLLLGGRASDILGRQRLFIAGVVVFTAASFLSGVAGSSGVLVVGRALQGLGAALVSPAALSIVTTTFAEGRERTKALGVWSAIAAGGGAVGLLLGGILTETISWRWIFFINIPIGVVTVLLALRFVHNSRAEKQPETSDVAGAVTVTGGLLVLVYAIVKAQDYGWGSLRTLGLGALAIVLLVAFVAIELRSREPLIRLGIFRIRSLTVANVAMLLVASGIFAQFYFDSLYVQEVLGYSPIQAGLAFLPFTAGIVVGAGLAQQLIARFGVRAVTLAGLTLATGGLALFLRLTPDGTYLSQLLVPILVMSVGMGLTFVPITLLATTNVEAADAGLASGLFNASQQIGGALGLAVLSTLATARTNHAHLPSTASTAQKHAALVDGFHLAFGTAAGFMAAALVLLALLVRRRDVEQIQAGEPVTVAA
jgi:EmrB/QacA subfamily drug resistance transporter